MVRRGRFPQIICYFCLYFSGTIWGTWDNNKLWSGQVYWNLEFLPLWQVKVACYRTHLGVSDKETHPCNLRHKDDELTYFRHKQVFRIFAEQTRILRNSEYSFSAQSSLTYELSFEEKGFWNVTDIRTFPPSILIFNNTSTLSVFSRSIYNK